VALAFGQAISAASPDQCPTLDPEVHRLLQAMASKAAHGDYSGVVTLQRGNDTQVMELRHSVVDGQATEVLSHPAGQDEEVLRSGHPGNVTQPGQQLLRAAGAVDGGVCGLAGSYRFRVGDGERIAGRDAIRLSVEPMDMYRFGYVFELDRDTAMMLKATTVSTDDRVLEQFQFASLSIAGPDQALAQPEQPPASRGAPSSASAPSGPGWEPTWLPEGFLPTDAAMPESARKSFTDGLACFSVFLEPLRVAIKPGEGVERMGSTVAYTRGVMLRQQPMLITVLGEIPTNTARMVADSVRLQ
jgi:sigma-E factor negative regulatory protein RseB